MGDVKNKITNENYQKMWCHRARVAEETKRYSTRNVVDPQITSVNRVSDHTRPSCLGTACPSLVFTREWGADCWEGYCGADPQ